MHQSGVTYLVLLFVLAFSSAALAVSAEVFSVKLQRQREQELLWIGQHFREAIGLYYMRSPGMIKRYPAKLEDLLEDRRQLATARYLRRIYRDPLTLNHKWGLLRNDAGGIVGVFSLSGDTPLKRGGFPDWVEIGREGNRYSDWHFVYRPPLSQ